MIEHLTSAELAAPTSASPAKIQLTEPASRIHPDLSSVKLLKPHAQSLNTAATHAAAAQCQAKPRAFEILRFAFAVIAII